MTDRTFVDANVLVYAHDANAGAERDIARTVLGSLRHEGGGTVSPQVLQEFYVTVTRELATPLARSTARAVVETYAQWCVDVTSADVTAAFRIEDEATIAFRDALIVASAARAGARTASSEDLDAGRVVAGVRVVNPFDSPR